MEEGEKTPKEVVRAYVKAFNRGDLAALRALLADDAEIQGVLGRGTFERVAPIWRQLIEGYGMQLTIENGRIQRRWGARDAASQARQLGIPVE